MDRVDIKNLTSLRDFSKNETYFLREKRQMLNCSWCCRMVHENVHTLWKAIWSRNP